MTENIRTLRPGLLVSLKTSIRGNIHYRTVELESTHVDTETGEQRARWETERVITDPEEHAAASKVRSKIRNLIVGECAQSAFGLLCPESNADALYAAMAKARELADEFNEGASLTRMSINVLYGRIAQDDVEAVRAITSEIRGLMEDMREGLEALDVKAVRDACSKASGVSDMLTPDAKGRLEVAIEAARKAARQIVKAGEQAAIEVDRATLAKIDMARTSFLDVDSASAEVANPTMDGRAVDLAPEIAAEAAAYTAATKAERQRQLDMGGEVA